MAATAHKVSLIDPMWCDLFSLQVSGLQAFTCTCFSDLLKFSFLQVSMPVFRFSDFEVGVHLSRSSGWQVAFQAGMQVFRFSGWHACRFSGFQVFRLACGFSGFQAGMWVFRFSGWHAGFQVFRLAWGFSGFQAGM